MRRYLDDAASIEPYLVLLIVAAGLWFAGAIMFGLIPEVGGATGGGRNGITSVVKGIGILKTDRVFRAFVIARCLLLSVELVMPFLVLHARGLERIGAADLGVFVIAVSLAAVISSPVWGRFSDLAAQRVLAMSGLLDALAVGVALLIGLAPDTWQSPFVYGVAFVILGRAEGGTRLGRKTYQVDLAPPDEKGTYQAVSNTVAGIVALAAGGLGFIAAATGIVPVLIGMAVVMLAGATAAWSLPAANRH